MKVLKSASEDSSSRTKATFMPRLKSLVTIKKIKDEVEYNIFEFENYHSNFNLQVLLLRNFFCKNTVTIKKNQAVGLLNIYYF
jgi:hypothetical protein